jgi:hypothetical protein
MNVRSSSLRIYVSGEVQCSAVMMNRNQCIKMGTCSKEGLGIVSISNVLHSDEFVEKLLRF